jgi:hypothetical protein
MIGCDPTSNPGAPVDPKTPKDSIGHTDSVTYIDSVTGFIPLAVGNVWRYSLQSSWHNGHNDAYGLDSGFRRITLISRIDSAGEVRFRAQIEDSVFSLLGLGVPPITPNGKKFSSFEISVVEKGNSIGLTTQIDYDHMLVACFARHAYPDTAIRKTSSSAYVAKGLPDTILIATDTFYYQEAYGPGLSVQAQGVGQLEYTIQLQGSFNANGSITAPRKNEYRLLEFRVSP